MTIWMEKSITDESEFKRINARLREARIIYFMHINNGHGRACFADGVYYGSVDMWNSDWKIIDFETLVSEGLVLKVNVGNYKRSPRRHNLCRELGFKLEKELP